MNASFTFIRRLGLVAAVTLTLTASARANAPAGRYTVSSGTVFDTKTKLTWQQTVSSMTYVWMDAVTYCGSTSVGPSRTIGGTGWRVPTLKELLTIIDYSQSNPPAIDSTAFPGTPLSFFWSATSLLGQSGGSVWIVDSSEGFVTSEDPSQLYYVRCVR